MIEVVEFSSILNGLKNADLFKLSFGCFDFLKGLGQDNVSIFLKKRLTLDANLVSSCSNKKRYRGFLCVLSITAGFSSTSKLLSVSMFVVLLSPSLRSLIAQAHNWQFNKIRGGIVLWGQCFSHQRALWGTQCTYLNLGCEWWLGFAFHDCSLASLTWKIKLSHCFAKVTEENLFPAKRNFNKDFFQSALIPENLW